VLWVGFLKDPLDVVLGRPRLMLVTTYGGRDVPHAGSARLPIIAITVVGSGHVPLNALLAPLFATLDALPATVGGNVRRRSLTATRGCLPASLGWARHDRLKAIGMLGGDAARGLECVPEKVTILALVRAPCTVLGLRTHAPR
jgi:hypothetical protein